MMIENKTYKKCLLIFLIVICLSFIKVNHSDAGTVIVKPGKFDHFSLQMPDKIIAGENVIIKVQVYDSNNNLITNFSEYGKEFRIETNGSLSIQPSILNASSFPGGSSNITINGKKAEKIIFSIRESGGTVPVISREITILPNKLDHFVLQAPEEVTAGKNFDIRVIAKDLFDNTVNDLDIGRNIKITSTGTSSVEMIGSSAIDFTNGTATVNFVSERAGNVFVELQEISTGSRGTTQKINVNPSSLSYFKLKAPKNAIAGDPFDLLVAAYDSYANIITNYSSVGNGVNLSTSGSSKIEPTFISPSEFKTGQVTVRAFYEKAEDIQIIAKERNSDQKGQTSNILILNAAPDHFVVVTPETAQSGQKFKIKIEAYDRFNNIVENYNLTGNVVALNTTGTGEIFPDIVSPSEFRNGIAMVDVTYDKAESFLISAKMSAKRKPGRVAVKEPKVKKRVPKKEEIAVIPVKPEKRIEKVTEIEAVQEYLEKAQVKQPDRIAKAKTEKKEIKKKIIPRKKMPEVTKKPEIEIARKEDIKVKKPAAPYMVNNVSIIEAKDKAMLVINITDTNSELNVSDEIESKHGKEWLKLTLDPAVYKTENAFSFKSYFVGEVLLEEDQVRKNVLYIYVELLPAGVTFDIARVKNTVIVTMATH